MYFFTAKSTAFLQTTGVAAGIPFPRAVDMYLSAASRPCSQCEGLVVIDRSAVRSRDNILAPVQWEEGAAVLKPECSVVVFFFHADRE